MQVFNWDWTCNLSHHMKRCLANIKAYHNVVVKFNQSAIWSSFVWLIYKLNAIMKMKVTRNGSLTSTRNIYTIPGLLVMAYMFSFPIQKSVPAKSPNPFLYSVQFRVKLTEPLSCCIKMIQLLVHGSGSVVPTDKFSTFCCTQNPTT